jgi:hypothetical protein
MKRLGRKVKNALEKARDSALLAVEVYNKPAVKFKSGGYITLMVIAWTSLFHAIFFKKRRKPFCKEHGRFLRIENDFRYWELAECLSQYFKTDTGNPVRKNLEFFIPLRNKIEHRSMPELDASIFGECQAMLLNFDAMLEKEFASECCLRESLSFSLQLFPSSESLVDAIKRNPGAKPIVDFIHQYRSTISPEVIASGKYSFKAFLIQVANHKSENALPIQFVHYDKLSNEEKEKLGHVVAMVKFKEVPVANPDIIRPGEVVKKVQAGLGDPKVTRNGKQVNKFTLDTHSRCWHKYKVRPPSGSSTPHQTDWKYCVYDKMHEDYGYTQAWIDFLVQKLKDPAEFESLYSAQATIPEPPSQLPNASPRPQVAGAV